MPVGKNESAGDAEHRARGVQRGSASHKSRREIIGVIIVKPAVLSIREVPARAGKAVTGELAHPAESRLSGWHADFSAAAPHTGERASLTLARYSFRA